MRHERRFQHCARAGHRLLTDDISTSDSDLPSIASYRQLTDAHLLTLARRRAVRLVTFDASILAMGNGHGVEALTTLCERPKRILQTSR